MPPRLQALPPSAAPSCLELMDRIDRACATHPLGDPGKPHLKVRLRVLSQCRFGHRGTGSLRGSGIKWVSGGAK
jgi:hypothetical protein